MTAQFDEASQRWRVVGYDGTVIKEFQTNAQAWRWIDDHGNNALEIRRDRVRDAFRSWHVDDD